MAVEFLTDLVLHKFDDLVLHAVSFGLGGNHLPLRSVLALLGVEIQRLGRGAVKIQRQQAVNHHIRVAAYGRSEMSVEAESQAVVADIVG